jgi:hypothetical protein
MTHLAAVLRDRRTVAVLFFPVALQLHLEALATSGFLYLPLAVLFALVVLVGGGAVTLVNRLRKRTTTAPFLRAGSYVVLAIFAGSVLAATQYTENARRGIIVASAVEAYRAAHNRWPSSLHVVDTDLPQWRYGLLSYDFVYWIHRGEPQLKFCAGGCLTGVFYSFDKKHWYKSTM